jgi:hypothetical protein
LWAVYSAWEWWDRRQVGRPALTDKLLRGPGDYIIGKLSGIEMDIAVAIIITMLAPLIAAGSTILSGESVSSTGSVLLSFAVCLFTSCWLWKLLGLRKNYLLGLQGERVVAERLNQLMLKGCRVFHDLQMDKGNIDHIVVAPTGVYCIETKCISKRRVKTGEDWLVEYDGQSLRFPFDKESKRRYGDDHLRQVRKNTKWLSDWLSQTLTKDITVNGILAYPGWNVRESALDPDGLRVLSHKSIAGWIDKNKKTPLDENTAEMVTNLLGDKCKNLELAL